MLPRCPYSFESCANSGAIVRHGYYFRKSDGRFVPRFKCSHCQRHFSGATAGLNYGQKKRQFNFQIFKLFASGMSQRRIAIFLNLNKNTIPVKLSYLSVKAKISNHQYLWRWPKISSMQFDDLETIEHTKLKPVSVTMAVEKHSRFIIGFEVSRMPAKGRLVYRSIKKYGYRADERARGRNILFKRIKPHLHSRVLIESDQSPHYPGSIKRNFPDATHLPFKGIRGCITGQGELKATGYDPLFSLNHTFGMLRANVNRLFRQTWCTTKKMEKLRDHLEIYVQYHNQFLLPGAKR